MAYEWEQGMGEISGFGGGYENTCRAMVKAGCDWLDAHPGADPKFHSYKGVYGIISEDNKDAKDLTEAIVKAAAGDCTGAMHQAAVSHVLAIRKLGWKAYVKEMSKPKE